MADSYYSIVLMSEGEEEVKPPTVCLNMIVKNESGIIERLLTSILGFIDCYCICDTGSNDGTQDVIKNFFDKHNISGKIVEEPFKSFDHNRNVALKAARGMADYIIFLDGDMVIENKTKNKLWLLDADVFSLYQTNTGLCYHNIRIIKDTLQDTYYVGATHEYVNIPAGSRQTVVPVADFHILDVNDGGSKGNKFTRDIRLLTEELHVKPENPRTLFYLANTYHDTGEFKKAIEVYKRRAGQNNWFQEEAYSCYRIANCYAMLGKMEKAVHWWYQAYSRHPARLEPLYRLIEYYKAIPHMRYLAAQLYGLGHKHKNSDDLGFLFMEKSIYEYGFAEMGIIVKFHGTDHDVDNEMAIVLNRGGDAATKLAMTNYKFYCKSFPMISKDISSKHTWIGDKTGKAVTVISSSASIIQHPHQAGYILNQRFVNYTIPPDGGYVWYPQYFNINHMVTLNGDFEETDRKVWEQEEHERQYAGIEDVRLHWDGDEITFTGTVQRTNKDMGMGIGKYDSKQSKLTCEDIVMEGQGACEKNWVRTPYKGEAGMIYKWQPLQVGKLGSDNTLEILHRQDMPGVFSWARGSTNACVVGDDLWFIVHIMSYEAPRRYYHMFAVMDKDFGNVRYSPMRTFAGKEIEYCLSLIVEDERIIVTYSTWDRTTHIGIMERSAIENMLIKA